MDTFVYGTLTDRNRAVAILGEDGYEFVAPARLRGLHRVEGRYPTLAPGGHTDGRLIRTDRIEALDRYEGVADGLYVRVSVPDDASGRHVAVYVGDPDRLDTSEPVEWPGDGPFGEQVERYVRENGVHVERLD